MGGEKLLVRRSVGWRWGSPPHGRGKDPLHHMVDGAAIITPAWAGKSTQRSNARNKGRDHPRMGGEKTKKIP